MNIVLLETDLIAITIALVGSVATIAILFRNNYLLRQENIALRNRLRSSNPPF